ncbi:DNA damage-regulated autophagy modulator protein 2-like [Pomacea canaliculata]|uniref:DNA damage-regulated autophagy modulator protein 2-like n=1 Tax=Pomacea canaliculata TaxID=400727 RepID=UPI000D72E68A|nr:DNA damage-regulated autophagy modulator protein 2-like [Pomacea canaliculata]XP_025085168.1 DNA damage-regulated autophagy modulator protein 2-like [Pomacea canaliculata]XP_025085169.1 DNA damage-regulated autophagy modulator protein 2-like [Pomacea canaliculata]XP_025085170.1 DNA damage-regulated autophagy modulator protein 2-like [Pomacea canaliculata]
MSYLGCLPIFLVIVASGTFCLAYIIAVVRGDVSAAFPYISDTGAEVPESCIFGQFLNIASFLAFCTIYVRYKAVKALAGEEDTWLRRTNKISAGLGFLSAFGCSIVANFQEHTVVEIVHIIGAGFTFIGGVVYCFLQTAMSYHMYPDYNGLLICRVRLFVCMLAFGSLISTIASAAVALTQYKVKDRFHWNPDEPGYSAHVVSTVSEWLTALTFLGYFFTFVQEFRKFDLEINTRPLVRHLDEDPFEGTNERTRLLA